MCKGSGSDIKRYIKPLQSCSSLKLVQISCERTMMWRLLVLQSVLDVAHSVPKKQDPGIAKSSPFRRFNTGK